MKFAELTGYFQELEKTSSRNSMTEIVSQLLGEADKNEVKQLVYLMLGQLGPRYAIVEFQLAEKMVMRTLAEESGKELVEITRAYKAKGDLGLVAEELIKRRDSELSVAEVYSRLEEIAREAGSGSQERKISGLVTLLRALSGREAKYVVRVVMGKLRLGFSDKTILDAISVMERGSKEGRAVLEQAYQMQPDIGTIAQLTKEYEVDKVLEKIEIHVGTPLMPALCQRLKTANEMINKMGEVEVEPKFDGTRCVGGYTGILTKKRGYITVRELRVGDDVLTHKGRFRKVVAIHKRRRRPGEKIFQLQSYLGERLTISEGHRLLTVDGKTQQWKMVDEVASSTLFFPQPVISGKPVADQQVFADQAGYKKQINLSVDFFRFLGYWVGDGISNNTHQTERVGLVFQAASSLQKDYLRIIRETLQVDQVNQDKRRGAVVWYWRDKVLRQWLCMHFLGDQESGKRIPQWFWGLDKKRFVAFMRGWQEADGTQRKLGNRIVTKERQLAGMALMLGFKHGLPIGVRRVRMAAVKNGVKKTYYELIIPGTKTYVWGNDKGYSVKIHDFKRTKVNGKLQLYDIQVEKDESFCSSVLALHNCQIHVDKEAKQGWKVKTFTRNLEETTAMFPELKNAVTQIMAQSVILDSEAVGIHPKTGKLLPFQVTMTRKRKHGIADAARTVPLKFFVFDILYKDGKALIGKPLSERRNILRETVTKGKVLEVDEVMVTRSADELRAYHSQKLKEGLEGVVVKQAESKYEPGRRGFTWVKFKEVEEASGKLSDTIDAVVLGYYRGRGKRAAFGIGAFLVGVRGNSKHQITDSNERLIITIAKIGTGLSDAQWKEMRKRLESVIAVERPSEYKVDKALIPDVWVEPEVVVEIAADEITKSPVHTAGYALRFPRLVRFRDDKAADQVTSLAELMAIRGKS